MSTGAIVNAINDGKILGVGLDVLEIEKFLVISEQEWFTDMIENERILLSPHVAGWTFQTYRKISEVLAEKLKALPIGIKTSHSS